MRNHTSRLVVLFALAVPLLAGLRSSNASAEVPPVDRPAVCLADASDADPPDAGAVLDEGGPTELSLAVLAAAGVDQPPRAQFLHHLTLRRLGLPPGAESVSRYAHGPILYYVEAGTIEIWLEGGQVIEPLAEGDSWLLPEKTTYSLINVGGEASVLRLSLTPPEGETLISGDPVDVIPDEQNQDEGLASRLLLSVRFQALPRRPVTLFMACIGWAAPASGDAVRFAVSGPVGMLVLRGSLEWGSERDMEEGTCAVAVPDEPGEFAPRSGDPGVLVVGVVPENRALWADVDDGANEEVPRAELQCGEPDDS